MKPLLLRNLDLNLLYSFSILMEELNVSRAAERLYIGQPGLSTALKRLREALDDQLFVRVGRKLQPTPRALAIAPDIARALATIERSIQPLNTFDPKSWTGEFRVGLCDNLEMAFFGALTASLREKAPRARVVAVAATKRDSVTLLDEGAYDFSVAVHNEPASWHVRVPLFEQHLMCLYDSRKMQLSSPISTDDYLNAQHVTVSSQGSDAQELDNFLQKAGIRREVAASVSRYAAVGPVLQAIGAIATVPETVAFCMARIYGLKTSPTPIQLPSEPISMLYRKVDDVSGSSAWFRQQFMEVAAHTLLGLDPDAKCVHRGSVSHVIKDDRM